MNSESSNDDRPSGRDEVRAAVLAATRDLVAERGPDRFSVRDIANRAGVNHALVHRYFGTKADVLKETLAEESRDMAAAVAESLATMSGRALEDVIAQLLGVLSDRPTYWRALVNAVLDEPGSAVPGTASTTEVFSGLWRGGDPSRADATALAGVTVLGWLIFGGFMTHATDADAERVRRVVVESVSELIAPGSRAQQTQRT